MNNRFGIIFTLLLLFLPASSFAQSDLSDFGTPPFRIFADKDGLPQNTVQTAAIDRKNYFWIGTQDGAAYYNGRKWTDVDMPNNTVSNDINAVLPSTDGSIWFGSEGGGLIHKDGDNWTIYDQNSGLPNQQVRCILESLSRRNSRIIWAGTNGGGLVKIQDGKLTAIDRNSGLPDDHVRCLLESISDEGTRTLWVGTRNGLAKFENEKWTSFDKDSGLPDNRIWSMLETESGGRRTLWIGTLGGLARYENNQWTIYNKESGLPSDRILCLKEIASKNGSRSLWVGTNEGLAKLENGRWSVYTTASGLPNNWIVSLTETSERNGSRALWIGTNAGLARLGLGQWTAFDIRAGLPSNEIWSFLETRSKEGGSVLWIGTSSGLVRFEDGKKIIYDLKSGLPSNFVVALLESTLLNGEKIIWVGTTGGGLARLENNRWTVYNEKTGLPHNSILSLLETVSDNGAQTLWAGTNGGGLARFENNKWTIYNENNGLPGGIITSLLQTKSKDGKRALWVGTNNGLAKFEDGKWSVYDLKSGLPNNGVNCLFEAREENGKRALWVGTNSGGACRLDLDSTAPQWTIFSETTSPALPNNSIHQIQQDAYKRIYFFTNKGIARFEPNSRSPENKDEYSTFVFTIEDGLPSNECLQGAAMIDGIGRIWAGTAAGAAMYDPSKEIADRSLKPLYIEQSFLINNNGDDHRRLIKAGESLAHNDNSIRFEYALLSYFRESQTRYRTQLEGIEDQPSQWTAAYYKEYTTLPEGDYKFKVWGKDYAGNISGPVEIAFNLRPAPWRTWWAYFFYTGLICGAGYIVIRRRLQSFGRQRLILEERIRARTADLEVSEKRAVEANRAKSLFLANMSHELRTPLNAILGFVQLMERDRKLSGEQKENLRIIARSGEHLLSLINDVLSISKIESGRLTLNERAFDLLRLLKGLEEMFRERASEKRLQLVFRKDSDLPKFVKGDDGKLRQVLINLLGNALKFTEKGVVSLRAQRRNEYIRFEIADTGLGIEKDEIEKIFEAFAQSRNGLKSGEGTGLGLTISRTFVRMMGGEIKAESEPGAGSKFFFEIPLAATDGSPSEQDLYKVRGLQEGRASCRTLVADDTAESRMLLMKLLSSVGIEAREASNGQDAFDIWAEWKPDAILMDMRMPLMNGLEAAGRIRTAEAEQTPNPERRTKIIALSAGVFEWSREEIIAAGCDDYLVKPFHENAVLEKMAEHLGLNFIYEEIKDDRSLKSEEMILRPQRLVSMPKEARDRLNQALVQGDIEAAYRAVEEVRSRDNELAEALKIMIKSYRFDEIQELLEEM